MEKYMIVKVLSGYGDGAYSETHTPWWYVQVSYNSWSGKDYESPCKNYILEKLEVKIIHVPKIINLTLYQKIVWVTLYELYLEK